MTNEQNSGIGLEPMSPQPSTSGSGFKRLLTGAAIAAIPMAGAGVYLYAQHASNEKAKAQEKGFQYDTSKLKEVDPALIRYHAVGKIDTGLKVPRVMTTDKQGNLLVAGDRVVRVMSTTGGMIRDISLSDAPFAIGAADDGSILVSFRNRIQVIGTDGKAAATWTLPSDAYVTGIAVSGEHVYLADSARRLVMHTDRTGKLINEIGKADPNRHIDGLVLPSPHLGVAIAEDGTIWVNNAGRHRMENYSPDGTLERFWGQQGTSVQAFPGCCNPTDFHLLADGSFITTEKGIARVKHYLADGRFDYVIAAPQSFGPNMTGLGVMVDMAGRVLVLERGTSIVHVFARNEGSGK